MYADRLLRLAALLRRDAANPEGAQFDLGYWAAPSEGNELKRGSNWALPEDVTKVPRYQTSLEAIKVPVSCGTTACAMGLAAISGEFAAEGLSYTFLLDAAMTGLLVPTINGVTGFAAACQLFDISSADADYLFDPGHYSETPREADGELLVAQRIENFTRGVIDEEHHADFSEYNDDEDDSED